MEAKNFKTSRDSRLAEFQTEYDKLRTQYSSALLSAIQEEDSQKQQELIQEVLNVNSEMTAQVRTILGVLSQGTRSVDTSSLDKLTKDLIDYQKQHNEIQQSEDKVKTLKMIQSATQEKIDNAYWMYMFYLFALIGLIFIVSFLVLRTPSSIILPSIIPSGQPVFR
jgi:predicted RND superfamily exporter protein